MAVPTRRKSRTAQRKRRTHCKIPKVGLVACSHCQELILPHHVCPKCGYYNGKEVIAVED